jgi:hypothetical protein
MTTGIVEEMGNALGNNSNHESTYMLLYNLGRNLNSSSQENDLKNTLKNILTDIYIINYINDDRSNDIHIQCNFRYSIIKDKIENFNPYQQDSVIKNFKNDMNALNDDLNSVIRKVYPHFLPNIACSCATLPGLKKYISTLRIANIQPDDQAANNNRFNIASPSIQRPTNSPIDENRTDTSFSYDSNIPDNQQYQPPPLLWRDKIRPEQNLEWYVEKETNSPNNMKPNISMGKTSPDNSSNVSSNNNLPKLTPTTFDEAIRNIRKGTSTVAPSVLRIQTAQNNHSSANSTSL